MTHDQRLALIPVFESTILAKRTTLQTLYEHALGQWEYHEKLGGKGEQLKQAGRPQPHDLTIAQSIALSAAQDAANAFVLIVDYSMRRFWRSADLDFKTYRLVGVNAYQGASIKLHDAITALANQVRHLEETTGGRSLMPKNAAAFKALGLDQSHDSAASLFVVHMNRAFHDYVAVERHIIENCKVALADVSQA